MTTPELMLRSRQRCQLSLSKEEVVLY